MRHLIPVQAIPLQGNPARRRIANARVIAREFDWLEAVIACRCAAYGGGQAGPEGATLPPLPSLRQMRGPYAALVRSMSLGLEERLVLILALAPYLAPERLDPLLIQNAAT